MVNIDKYGVKISDDCKTEPRVQMSDNVIVYENLKYRIKDDSAYLIGVDDEKKLSCSLVIPDHIIVEGEAIPVVGIDERVVESWNGFSNVISIIIPDSITSIGSYNFRELNDLQSIVIGSGVQKLVDCLIYCESLCSIVCNENLEFLQNVYSGSIRETKWYQLQPYGSVCLGATLIGCKLASNEELKQYKVPDNVRYIMHGALDECKDLQSIDLNKVEIVDCKLPNNVSSIVASGDSLQEVESLDNTIWYKNQPCGCVNIGSLLYRYKKEDIITPPFIQLPQQTRIINKQAFSLVRKEYYEYGEPKDIPCRVICNKELVCIGESAFENSAVTEICLPKGIIEIRDNAFKNSCLRAIEFPDILQKLGKSAFENCQLKSVNIPTSINVIPECAFLNNESLSCVLIPDSVTEIADGAFSNCSLRNVHIPRSVVKIGNDAFSGNNWLDSVVLSEGIKIIGKGAFSTSEPYGNLHIIEVPSTIKEIGVKAFRREDYFEKIDTLIIEADLDVFWSELVGKNLETVILKDGITIIPKYGFDECKRLCNIIIPSTLQSIGEFAFRECESLESLIFPSNIEELWSNSLPPNIKKVVLKSGKLKLKISICGKERLDYYVNNRVFVDTDGNIIEPEVVIFDVGDENEDGQLYFKGRYYDIKIVDEFEEFVVEDSEPDDIDEDGNYRSSYSQYGGYNGYDDDTINSAFEGDPEATWNID